MGGIVGAYRREGHGPADRGLLVRQTELLALRGPDDGAVYLEGPFALGHRRFDAEGRGHQPCWDQESRIGVIIDGDLDALPELRSKLLSLGHRIPNEDAPSVVLAAYREWGDGCVERLSGVFAFAILDRAAGHLLLARDRLGGRPLYYHVDARRFAFASEVRALLADPGVPRVLDPQSVAEWFALGFVREPRALFRGVRAVLPGEALLVGPNRVRSRRYWSPGELAGAQESAVSTLRDRLEEAVRGAFLSDALVAMSGGRVSTTLAVLVRHHYGRVSTLTLPGLDGRDRCESLRAADELGFHHHEAPLGLNPMKTVRSALDAMDLPVGDPWFICHAALARGLKTPERPPSPLLVGHGALEAVLEPRASNILPSALTSAFLRGPDVRAAADSPPSEGESAVLRLASSELRVADRLSVLAGRPVRPVFATPEVLTAALGIRGPRPSWSRLSRGWVPTRVSSRPPARLAPPLASWMRGPLNRMVESVLFDEQQGRSGLLERRRLRWWWYQHQLGLADRSAELWRAVVFEHWHRSAMTGESPLKRRRRLERK